jgi:uncharacterized protein (TIGR02996 family)
MTLMGHPEEARLIRGIAAEPEDEALRLVYADWLEEHGHEARAAYLRAEARHFKAKRKKKADAWADAEGVDPVWKAMVSRPPFGILRPELTFSAGGPPITVADLKALEKHWKAPLPSDYAAFLLLHNGGVPSMPDLMVTVFDDEYEEEEDAGSDSGQFGFYEPELRLYALGEMDPSGKRAHWTSAAEMCSGRGRSDATFKRLMLVGTLTYHHGEPWVNRFFLEPSRDAAHYLQLDYTDDGDSMTTWEADVHYDSFIDLLEDLQPRSSEEAP